MNTFRTVLVAITIARSTANYCGNKNCTSNQVTAVEDCLKKVHLFPLIESDKVPKLYIKTYTMLCLVRLFKERISLALSSGQKVLQLIHFICRILAYPLNKRIHSLNTWAQAVHAMYILHVR